MKDPLRPWLNNYDPEVSPTLTYESIPAFTLLDRAAERFPKNTAIRFKNYSLTYAELHRQSEIMAANLRSHGLRPGDRISIMMPNLPQAIISYWAALKAGGVVVMTNPLYMEKELVHHIHDSGSRMMITLDVLWPKLEQLGDKLALDKIFVSSIADGLGFPLNYVVRLKVWKEGKGKVPYDGAKVQRWKDLLQGRERFSCTGIVPKTDLALLQYTGGTTGISKGCMISHYNLVANAVQCSAILHDVGKQEEIFLAVMPFFHIYGLTTCLNFPTALGATIVPFPRFVPQDVLSAIGKVKPTIFPGAPSVYIALMQQREFEKTDFQGLRYCVSGSAPMPMEVMQQFKARTGAEIIEGYGLTEASPVTHLNPLGGRRKPGAIGLPFPDTDAAIVDMEVAGPPLPSGKHGELIVRGPQIMSGYWNRADETASALRNGWLFTGDIATMDEDGYFYIVDRKKDLIISGGYNIYPREIDEVLYEHPKVKEAVTVGIPHKTRGEVVKAYIIPRDGETIEKAEIVAFCKKKLAGYKVPRQVEFRTELPKTLVGKVLRRALREEEEGRRQCPPAVDQTAE